MEKVTLIVGLATTLDNYEPLVRCRTVPTRLVTPSVRKILCKDPGRADALFCDPSEGGVSKRELADACEKLRREDTELAPLVGHVHSLGKSWCSAGSQFHGSFEDCIFIDM